MIFTDSVMKDKLKNVYFIWGRGKTTIANELQKRYGCYIYSTDEARDRLMLKANSHDQPYMCRDYVKEYGVKSFWELPKEVVADRENHFLEEVTPMIVVELIALSSQYDTILCEGDIGYKQIMPIASHMVYLRNQSTTFDWFNRPDHIESIHAINNRMDLTENQKAAIIQNAYDIVSLNEAELPEWVMEYKVKHIDWNDNTSIEQTAMEVTHYFDLKKSICHKQKCIDIITKRRSIRKYRPGAIEQKEIEAIVKAGTLAPSAKNRQPWKYIVFSGDSKETLLNKMEHGLVREQEGQSLLPDSRDGLSDAFHTLAIMRQAPVIIMILNTNGSSPFATISNDARITEICDTLSIGASIQNMLLTATEMGLGTLWIANTCFAYKELVTYLGTPKQLVGAIALGYPDEMPNARPRKDMSTIVEYR